VSHGYYTWASGLVVVLPTYGDRVQASPSCPAGDERPPTLV
jgi:hypothetical protein